MFSFFCFWSCIQRDSNVLALRELGDSQAPPPRDEGKVMGALQSVFFPATGSNEKSCSKREEEAQNELRHGMLGALAVVPECQNRPSGETSHSN